MAYVKGLVADDGDSVGLRGLGDVAVGRIDRIYMKLACCNYMANE